MPAIGLRFVLIIVCSISSPISTAAAAADGRGGATVYDYLMLTREWPFSFCSIEACHDKQLLQKKFNIHGLWAESAESASNNNNMPMFCNVTFNETDLAPLRKELQENWMDLTKPNGSALSFWREEFKKHGSCVATYSKFNTTYVYFDTALQLDAKNNLMDMLAKGGVKPSLSPLNASDIRKALRDSFGFDAGVRCAKANNKTYLYELRLCFTKDLKPRNCDEKPTAAPTRYWSPQQLRQQSQLQDVQSPFQRFLMEAARFLGIRWEAPAPAAVAHVADVARPPGRLQSSGTYACNPGEMVLMQDSASA